MSDTGLPSTAKVWRCRVRMENSAGELTNYNTVLMTEKAATEEMLEYLRHGQAKDSVSVVLDQAAAVAFQAAAEERRKTRASTKKATRSSH